MEPKRRLPLLNAGRGEEAEGVARSPWQWVGFGVLGIFVVWVPLSWLAVLATQRMGDLDPSPVHLLERALPFVLSLALSALAGGYLMGRWGTALVAAREAALAGLASALLATVLTWKAAGPLFGAIAVIPTALVAVSSAALGGRLGIRRRR